MRKCLASVTLALLLVGCPGNSILGKWSTVSTGCIYPTDINIGELVFLGNSTAEWFFPTEAADDDGPDIYNWTRDGDNIRMTAFVSLVIDGVLAEGNFVVNLTLVSNNSMEGTSLASLFVDGVFIITLDCVEEITR